MSFSTVLICWLISLLSVVAASRSCDTSCANRTLVSHCPNPNDFACRLDNKTCIPRIKWQDGVEDCPDGSDEECLDWQYDCKFGTPRCVSLYAFMDGIIDCASGFDEACPAHYFVCSDRSACIDPKRFLDGEQDCKDGSDEPCPAAHFLCHDRTKCVPMTCFQDGSPDCPDGSDEECTLFQFECLCGSPRCIDVQKFNDSKKDCEDGSDELLQVPDSYRCPNGDHPRNLSSHVAAPPPGAPMVPCEEGDFNMCSAELNEVCLIIAGAPRCVCRVDHIRPPGSAKCIPAPTSPLPGKSTEKVPDTTTSTTKKSSQAPTSTTRPVLQDPTDVPEEICQVGNPATCPGKNEICAKTFNITACICDQGYFRNPDTAACTKLIDECKDPKANDCDPNALCMDNPLSYECLCREGYIDMSERPQTRPGRHCLPLVNECNDTRTNNCDRNATCLDLVGGYTCRCNPGFLDVSPNPVRQPGRKCSPQQTAGCAGKPADICGTNALCISDAQDYRCQCLSGYVKVSPNNARPLVCNKIINECDNETLNDCKGEHSECIDTLESFVCRCKEGTIDQDPSKPGRRCVLADECALGTHDCDPAANCLDTPEGYICSCPSGWVDVSPDLVHTPGHKCQKLANACENSTISGCDKEAICSETGNTYTCQCPVGYLDMSSAHRLPAGRICQKLINECQGKNDCSPQSDCLDTPTAYLCRCRDGFVDNSPDPVNKPGRVCVEDKAPLPKPECDVNDPWSCKKDLFEVCTFVNGTYRCGCASGVSRLPDGRCKVINECEFAPMHDCHPAAHCMDTFEEYTCACPPGYVDASPDKVNKPGRICKELVNECADLKRHKVDCDLNAICLDTELGYDCRCNPGFVDVSEFISKLPGRKCSPAVDECANSTTNDCSPNAICQDAKIGYSCRCKDGFVDASPNVTGYPGRVCNKPELPPIVESTAAPFLLEECDPNNNNSCKNGEICTKIDGQFLCDCPDEAQRFDGSCKVIRACDSRTTNDCDRNAICSNVFDSFICQCKPQFRDVSPDPLRKPGRKCKEIVNECASSAMNDCSPYADCIDTPESYLCACRSGYIDVSPQMHLPSGRRCQNTTDECSVRTLNTCDDNADCIEKPDGYSCQCATGFVDVSSSANLPPGRVCTVQTSCPKQPTDLMFLVDGSGSIGSFIFKNEVLRFVREFVTLFDISPDKTRVGFIQYSDQLRHEFELNQHSTKDDVEQAVDEVQYLTGLTRTGAAIADMAGSGFSAKNGARPAGSGVRRVCIVITDGRSQDNVTMPSIDARNADILMFAVGVTDHVLESELVQIAGNRDRVFVVAEFTDLNTRLRSLIQKAACPTPPPAPNPGEGLDSCDPITHIPCDRVRTMVCLVDGTERSCGCPDKFDLHPVTKICGGITCNPDVDTSCPEPEVCEKTPYGTHRCICPKGYHRMQQTGFCVSSTVTEAPSQVKGHCQLDDASSCPDNEICVRNDKGVNECVCLHGLVRQPQTSRCAPIGSCNPQSPNPCDSRRREVCLPDAVGNYVCQCPQNSRRDSATHICLINECVLRLHNCDRVAICIDTVDSFLCQCPSGFLDQSPDPAKPGRLCAAESIDQCENGRHRCSPNAFCTNVPNGFICQCKPGFVDFSPNRRQFPGIDCRPKVNECANPRLNTCSVNATCIDTEESYVCLCKPGFTDRFALTNPGRFCEPAVNNQACHSGNNDCDPNAHCIAQGQNNFVCICPPGFKDKSPDPVNRPGRLCVKMIPECDNRALNDCDPENGICIELDEGFQCTCGAGFLDISPDPLKPGRICKKLINECDEGKHDCARDGGICEDTPDSFTCRCKQPDYVDISQDPANKPGRACKQLRNECESGLHDCSPHARCIDTPDAFTCLCMPGFYDVSTDPVNRPGRSCLKIVDECANATLNDCSPNAWCNDTVQAYRCQCRPGFRDESPDLINRPGRICRPNERDECFLNEHDCSINADCINEKEGYSCRCRQGFIDQSPNAITLPGRICVPVPPTTPRPECRIESINSCNVNLNEVCRLVSGQPKCVCPQNFQRNRQTNACTVINECLLGLHDCSRNADCLDELDGFTCRCKPNFKDTSPSIATRPGRVCQPLINECAFAHLNDCHQHAECLDLENGFQCRCRQGFMDMSPDPVNRPGRICHQDVDECKDPGLNTCDRNALCFNEPFGYRCECPPGFLDVSPTPSISGRACKPIVNECLNKSLNDCDPIAKCIDTSESYRCECPANSTDVSPNPAFPGRVCHVDVDECRQGLHDCDKNAICRNTEQSFVCSCPPGFLDRSPNTARLGRVCIKLRNECEDGSAACSPNADCRDLEEGYTCSCKAGYVDRSPNRAQPGRVCSLPEICPPNHDCSSAATCEPTPDGGYTCVCIPGYVDESSSDKPGRVCVLDNKCRDSKLNNCSVNAVCYSTPPTYRCECVHGFLDKSPDPNLPGRVCEPAELPPPPKRHPCQDPALNDCSLLGACRSLSTNTDDYTCECPAGYDDRSPDPVNKPGRVCTPSIPVCRDASQNDCHTFAICEAVGDSKKYTCRCRDGYIDASPDPVNSPGRVCKELTNECLDARLNDCSPHAICEDLPDGYTCRCLVNFKDESPDPQKPGRVCSPVTNECSSPLLNNCSRFADCRDLENGYECKCKTGYFDNNPASPGRLCALIIDECESANLNDCHSHAKCKDLPGGFTCECISPYHDESPDPRLPGRVCRFNECSDRKFHTCHVDAECVDTDDSYYCFCKDGYLDISEDPQLPGRLCEKLSTGAATPAPTTAPAGGTKCGSTLYCFSHLDETCVNGVRCACRPGYKRRAEGSPCVKVVAIPLPLRVIRRNFTPLTWASAFGNPEDARYIEIEEMFVKGVARAYNTSNIAPYFISSEVDAITHPRLYNASWTDGLMFNFTVYVTPDSVLPEQAWMELIKSCARTNYSIGGTELYIDPYQLNPFLPPPKPGDQCGDTYCDASLGEICVGGRLCACPNGKGRAKSGVPCVDLEQFTLPLWVFRRNEVPLKYNSSYADTNGHVHKEIVDTFIKGCRQAYNRTHLAAGFVDSEVVDILDPAHFNGSWDKGCMFNFTVYFQKGTCGDAKRAWTELIQSCLKTNYSLGGTELFINPLQPDPFSKCFSNNCHPKARCLERGNSYTCQCPPDYRDMDIANPGHKCVSKSEIEVCTSPDGNDCDENANCIDEPGGRYHCECKPGYLDLSPEGGPKGLVCVIDYCVDVPFCPANTTCQNIAAIQGARCECNEGYVDIRPSAFRHSIFGDDVFCLAAADVNECRLSLTNCSSVATCTNLIDGYDCACPAGYTDGNPSTPGRICAAPSCGLCNEHGDCEQEPDSSEVKCRCHSWYTGEYCDKDIRVILVILFAILFLLLTLCCLLYFCLKCRCVRGRGLWYREPLFAYRKGQWPWTTLGASSSSESGEGFSAMSTSAFGKGSDYYPDLAIPRAKLKGNKQDEHGSQSERIQVEQNKLTSYLETESADSPAIKIPRVKLSRASSVEREGSESVVFSDVNAHMIGGGQSMKNTGHYSVSESETETSSSSCSSDYTMREEIERRVITDVKRTQTSKTITAEVHNNATAEFHVYPPAESGASRAARTISEALSGLRRIAGGGRKTKQVSSRTLEEDSSSAAVKQVESFKAGEQVRDTKEIYVSSNYPGVPYQPKSECDRAQSVAEVSVAGVQGHGSEWGVMDTATSFSQPRAMSEFTDRDDIASIESRSVASSAEGAVFDKKVLVKQSREFVPDETGRGSTSRFRNEMTTTTVKQDTTHY